MSQRSIIEINHDCSHAIDAAPAGQVEKLIVRALASGSDESWEPLKRFGVRRIVQVHHSCDRKVVIGNNGVQLFEREIS
jgi:hypothetical protein